MHACLSFFGNGSCNISLAYACTSTFRYTYTHTHTHTYTFKMVQYIYRSMYVYISISLQDFMWFSFSASLFWQSDFDAKNTNDECVFHPNLFMFDVCYTHLYTTVTISKKKHTAILSLFSIIPTVLCMYLTVRRQMWYRQAKAASIMSSKAKRWQSAGSILYEQTTKFKSTNLRRNLFYSSLLQLDS